MRITLRTTSARIMTTTSQKNGDMGGALSLFTRRSSDFSTGPLARTGT